MFNGLHLTRQSELGRVVNHREFYVLPCTETTRLYGFNDLSSLILSRLFLQIAPATKKIWGEDQRDDKGLLHLNEHQPWRDSTWSTAANGMLRIFKNCGRTAKKE